MTKYHWSNKNYSDNTNCNMRIRSDFLETFNDKKNAIKDSRLESILRKFDDDDVSTLSLSHYQVKI